MKKSIQVSASILCADFTRLAEEVTRCEGAGVDMFHIDVMDGHFVPNITIGPLIVEALRPLTRRPLEAHLMIANPTAYLDDFLKAGADIISIQAECYALPGHLTKEADGYTARVDAVDADRMRQDLRHIRNSGKRAHVVLNPGSPLCFQSLLDEVDGVLVMSVNPGFAKQKFMPVALPKIRDLRKIFEGDIAIDGGINAATAPEAVKAGANILATASYFFGAEKPQEVVAYLKSLESSS